MIGMDKAEEDRAIDQSSDRQQFDAIAHLGGIQNVALRHLSDALAVHLARLDGHPERERLRVKKKPAEAAWPRRRVLVARCLRFYFASSLRDTTARPPCFRMVVVIIAMVVLRRVIAGPV